MENKTHTYEGIVEYDLSSPTTITKYTMDRLLKEKYSSELIALYAFYVYTANWQTTNQPKCTNNYVAKGLGWSVRKVARYSKILKEMGLIERITRYKNGRISGWYIKVNYVKAEYQPSDKHIKNKRKNNSDTNYNVVDDIQILNTNNKILQTNTEQVQTQFDLKVTSQARLLLNTPQERSSKRVSTENNLKEKLLPEEDKLLEQIKLFDPAGYKLSNRLNATIN